MVFPTRTILRAAFVLGCAFLLNGCASPPTPYHPAENGYGYSSEELSPGRFHVSFRGNAETSEKAVEASLFRRIVEIAEREGAGHFVIDDSQTECVSRVRTSPTTTCTYRQSTDAMFPYTFGVHERESFWHSEVRREFEARADIHLADEADCGTQENCFVTTDARAVVDEE